MEPAMAVLSGGKDWVAAIITEMWTKRLQQYK